MTNSYNKVLCTGVTSDLITRTYQHKEGLVPGFTKRYNINKLVFYQVFYDAPSAIQREKQLKGGSRQRKVELITSMNPYWNDLTPEL